MIVYIISYNGAGDNSLKRKKKKLIFHPSSVIFFIILTLSVGKDALITAICAAVHELGHYFAARLCSVKVEKTVIYPFGADMRLEGALRSYKKDVFIALSGPFTNLVLLASGLILGASPFFLACNLALAGVNLLPIKGLDGGNILEGILLMLFKPDTAFKFIKALTFAVLFALWLISVYLLFGGSADPSLFFIVCWIFASVFL